MKSADRKRMDHIRAVIDRIEREFPGSLVIWRNTGTASDHFEDDTEVFEAYMIREEDYERFVRFTWVLMDEIATPNGFSIMIHDLSPDQTRKYRWEEYRAEKQRRLEGFLDRTEERRMGSGETTLRIRKASPAKRGKDS